MASTSVESMREAVEAINKVAKRGFELHGKIFQYTTQIDWSDEKGTNLQKSLDRMILLILEPMPELKKARDYIEKLIKIVEGYDGIDF